LDDKSLDYYRQRARAECEAALNASSAEARHVHAEMAEAYGCLVHIAELEQRGELAPGKVAKIADAQLQRDEAEYGGHAPKQRCRCAGKGAPQSRTRPYRT